MTANDRLEVLEAEIRDLKASVLLALKATQRLDETSREQAALAETKHQQLREELAELRAAQKKQPEPEPASCHESRGPKQAAHQRTRKRVYAGSIVGCSRRVASTHTSVGMTHLSPAGTRLNRSIPLLAVQPR